MYYNNSSDAIVKWQNGSLISLDITNLHQLPQCSSLCV